jgi:YggT family protein
MIENGIRLVLEVVIGLFVFAALVRFYLQAFRAAYRNPLTDFVTALTDFAVRPLRRIVPGLYGLDLSSLVLAWGLEIILLLLLYALRGVPVLSGGPQIFPLVAVLAVLRLLRFSLDLLIGAVFLQAILSWVAPYSPMQPVLDSVTRPFSRRLRRFIPPIGNVDLTPLVVFLICELIITIPVYWLETLVQRAGGFPGL